MFLIAFLKRNTGRNDEKLIKLVYSVKKGQDDVGFLRINLTEQVTFKLGSTEFVENCQLERNKNSLRMRLKHLQESVEQGAWHT